MHHKCNNGFVCEGCAKHVPPAEKTSRNHCPWCFLSLHVDDTMPGDRNAHCGEKMIPISYLQSNSRIKIQFLCIKCGKIHNNKAADDDDLGTLDIKIKKWKDLYSNLFL